MAVVDLLNRRLSFVAAVFAFFGVIVGVVALATNYWTVINFTVPGTAAFTSNGTVLERGSVNFTWNGLFYQCTAGVDGCLTRFWATTFLLCLLGLIFLLVGGIFIVWDIFQITDRRFVIPFLFFISSVLLTAGIFDYGSWAPLNYHSSRLMISAVVFAYSGLPITAFIAGRYSTFDRFVVTTATNGN